MATQGKSLALVCLCLPPRLSLVPLSCTSQRLYVRQLQHLHNQPVAKCCKARLVCMQVIAYNADSSKKFYMREALTSQTLPEFVRGR